MENEKTALADNNTWVVVEKPNSKAVIVDTKWVFKTKKDNNGKTELFKARLVARGFVQKDLDYCDIYSPVVKMITVRSLIALSTQNKWPVYHLDVCSAFLNGIIKDDIYVTLPNNFNVSEGKICKLQRALYGLKGAPRCWYDKFNEFMLTQKFTKTQSDQAINVCIFM